MRLRLFGWLPVLLFLHLLSGCGNSSPPELDGPSLETSLVESHAKMMANLLQDPYWQKRWWLAKTVRIFRGGRGLLPAENVEGLMKLSESEIITQLQSDPRFGDMVLDFNLYFLGFKEGSIFRADQYDPRVFDFSPAITGAKEVQGGGDYLRFFDLNQPMYVAPLFIFKGETDRELSDPEYLRKYAGLAQASLREILQFATGSEGNHASVCAKLVEHQQIASPFLVAVTNSNLGNPLQLTTGWYQRLNSLCKKSPDRYPRLVEQIRRVIEANDALVAAMEPLFPATYPMPRSLHEIRNITLTDELQGKGWTNFYGFNQRYTLPNSSTNMNRKRAAYVLKRFFCDDLTPVGVENPKEHAEGPHGSQPSCFACHYKLDPMAGFFRNLGGFFREYTGPNIFFDDMAQADLQTYLQNWRAKPESGREWEVGYVRSINRPQMNDYGVELGDLNKILRQAPEVKSCLVRRMFQYFTSADQTIDGGYLKYLTDGFTERSGTNSAMAFKWLVGQMAMSQTYRNPDPTPGECYDFSPGHVPGNSPPCRVAFVLQKNCASCHDSVYASGNLDLTRWRKLPDGSMSFPHEDNAGNQRSMAETMEKIIHRLSASDPLIRMPKMKEMPSQERQELYLWAQEKLSQPKEGTQ